MAACAAGIASAQPRVFVFPIPGSHFANMQTQIVFRGLPISQLGPIIVTGSQSGLHRGAVLSDSDNRGGSFLPRKPFLPGEVVTVQTTLNVVGGQSGTFHFTIVQPAGPNRPSPFQFAARVPGDVLHFHSQPALQPAAIRVLKRTSAAAGGGDFFLAPHVGPVNNGPMILDPSGRLVFFYPLPGNDFASDFRVQHLFGQPVLTWWYGTIHLGTGHGVAVIQNSAYQTIAAVHASNGLSADFHEFQLTREGTALITTSQGVFIDARKVGGSAHQDTLDGVVQEIDIPTGLVLFQWDSLDHVPLVGSHGPIKKPYNFFHLNSIQEDTDGNLIISGRNTWSAYKVNRHTARTMWILGGRYSSFKMAAGTQFAYQHDVRVRGRGDRVVTLYDDGGSPFVHNARGLTLHIDWRHKRVTRMREDNHVPALKAMFEGNLQRLANGDDLVGWGQAPYFTQFDRSGREIFDARFVGQNISYRVWRFPWVGRPKSLPAVVAHARGGRMTVWASWNGATQVASWRVLGGSSPGSLRRIGAHPRTSFETTIVTRRSRYVAVEAVSRSGRVLSRSAPVRAG